VTPCFPSNVIALA
jgi:hypothetical protein